MSRFSYTVRSSSRWYFWNTNPMYRLLSSDPLPWRQRVHRLAEKVEFTGPAVVQHAQHGEQGGLARARRPHDRDELALADVEVDLAEHVRPAGAGHVEPLEISQ